MNWFAFMVAIVGVAFGAYWHGRRVEADWWMDKLRSLEITKGGEAGDD